MAKVRNHLTRIQKLGFKPNCQEKHYISWEKRQCFGTKRAAYPVLLTRGKRGKPVVSMIQRAEEVPKSEGYLPERAAKNIRR